MYFSGSEGEEEKKVEDEEKKVEEEEEEEDEEIKKWNMEDERIRLEESMDVDNQNKPIENAQEQQMCANNEEIKEHEVAEDDDSNLVDFQRVPTQLLKSDILNSTKHSDHAKKV